MLGKYIFQCPAGSVDLPVLPRDPTCSRMAAGTALARRSSAGCPPQPQEVAEQFFSFKKGNCSCHVIKAIPFFFSCENIFFSPTISMLG